ncbi:KaiA-binding protein, partial [Halobacteriales archaeon QH_8_68_33]
MRVSSGVPGFDELVEGGLLKDRLYVVSGPPGSGKTTFSSQFITQGAKEGENCLYITMHETEEELVQDMAGYDFGFDRVMASGKVQFLNLLTDSGKRTITQFGTDSGLTNRLVAFLEQQNIDRAVVDSTMLLQHFFDNLSEEITGFLSALKQTDTTIVLISEMTDPSSYADEHYLAHGVVFFHNYLESGGMTR